MANRDPYRDNDDMRNPLTGDERTGAEPDSRSEARGDARETVGNNAPALMPSRTDQKATTRRATARYRTPLTRISIRTSAKDADEKRVSSFELTLFAAQTTPALLRTPREAAESDPTSCSRRSPSE